MCWPQLLGLAGGPFKAPLQRDAIVGDQVDEGKTGVI